ncbi:butyrophilin subfamily 2 member A1-like isoform X1 [Salvelinus fontinalis]|uniref:butyrophilin subfamily 2 member A1-like isoform X1 n=1 Tax=Salvelinus fontinalis TaxID=8038 RepID=UPI0024867FE6|nr:butyrophilin subfamily 2 member A1-like isoform X1 [Salvelinus fontinalis]
MKVAQLDCLILLHLLHTAGSERFEVLGPTDPIVAVAGDDIILPCYLKPNISAEDMTADWLNLDSKDGRVYRYQNRKIIREDQILFYRGRTSLFEEELWRGNTSLKLTSVQGTDEGRYKCFIKAKSWYDDFTIQVLVEAIGSKPVVSIEGHREGGMGLLCESEGWHPQPELVWLDSKGVNLSAGPPETHRDFKGFYRVKQHVIVQETDTNRFTCRVQQSRINEKMETEIHLPSELFDYATPWRKTFIVLSCLGAVTVIGLALAIYCIHNKKGVIIDQLKLQRDDQTKEGDVIKKERDDLKKERVDLWAQNNDHTGKLVKVEKDLTSQLEILASQLDFVNTNWSPDFETIRRHAVNVTLDPDTAHRKLILSDDRKQVRHGELNPVLSDNGKRFTNWSCVLGNVGFSGKFYYEVKVEGKTEWTLGVVRKSIDMNESFRPIPNKGCWTLELEDGKYTAHADSPVTLLLREEPQKVGVFVDYEKCQVSFYNVEDRCHIYSFTGCTFTKKLYPFFNPGGSDSVSLVICPVDATD